MHHITCTLIHLQCTHHNPTVYSTFYKHQGLKGCHGAGNIHFWDQSTTTIGKHPFLTSIFGLSEGIPKLAQTYERHWKNGCFPCQKWMFSPYLLPATTKAWKHRKHPFLTWKTSIFGISGGTLKPMKNLGKMDVFPIFATRNHQNAIPVLGNHGNMENIHF